MTEQQYPTASWIAALEGDTKHSLMTSEGIERTEQSSGKDFVNSSKLPKDGDWETLKTWGIEITGETQDLFYLATLPEGWGKVASEEDSRHSYLIDNLGRKRASMFYKDAFYDRKAYISVYKDRYYIMRVYDRPRGGLQFQVIDKADGKPVNILGTSYYAVLKNTSMLDKLDKLRGVSPVGLLCDGQFFFDAIDSYENPGFRRKAPIESCEVITQDQMFKNFHHVKPIHSTIYAAEAKAQESAQEYLRSLPTGLKAWE